MSPKSDAHKNFPIFPKSDVRNMSPLSPKSVLPKKSFVPKKSVDPAKSVAPAKPVAPEKSVAPETSVASPNSVSFQKSVASPKFVELPETVESQNSQRDKRKLCKQSAKPRKIIKAAFKARCRRKPYVNIHFSQRFLGDCHFVKRVPEVSLLGNLVEEGKNGVNMEVKKSMNFVLDAGMEISDAMTYILDSVVSETEQSKISDCMNFILDSVVSEKERLDVLDRMNSILDSVVSETDMIEISNSTNYIIESEVCQTDMTEILDSMNYILDSLVSETGMIEISDNMKLSLDSLDSETDLKEISENLNFNLDQRPGSLDNTDFILDSLVSDTDMIEISNSMNYIIESVVCQTDMTEISDSMNYILDSLVSGTDMIEISDNMKLSLDSLDSETDLKEISESLNFNLGCSVSKRDMPKTSDNMNLYLDSLVSETNLSFRLSDAELTSRVDEVHTNNKQICLQDEASMWTFFSDLYVDKLKTMCASAAFVFAFSYIMGSCNSTYFYAWFWTALSFTFGLVVGKTEKRTDIFSLSESIVVNNETVNAPLLPKLYGGGSNNKVYMVSTTPLNPKTAREIIENPELEKVMYTPPVKPKAGEVFVYSHNGNLDKANDWKADKYIWVNRSGYGIPKKSKSFWKVRYNVSRYSNDQTGDTNFSKFAYYFKDKPEWHFVLIHYLGDETVFVPRPHGGSVNNTRPHERTCSSVLEELKSKVIKNSTGQVYKENINTKETEAVHQGILNARDKRQVKNLTTLQRKKYRISHDEIYGSLQIAHHISDYVKLLTIYPDLRIVFGSKDILAELNRVLAIKSDEPVLLSYDTTFNVGDFFVSVLVFRHVLFKDRVTIPAAFLIHDRKNQTTHDDFFRTISELVPNLNKGQHIIVTDREQAFFNAIKKYFPNFKQVYCWNHIRRDLRTWLTGKNASTDDKTVYSNDIMQLMQSDSLDCFTELEAELKLKWSEAMVEYFDNHLRDDIINHASKWVLEELDVYDSYSGVTNNMSEGTNNVVKGLQNWPGAPLDAILLSMHYLQSFKHNEIIRGRLNKGSFRLKSLHQNAALDPEDAEMPQDVCEPEKIIELVKGNVHSVISEPTVEDALPANATSSADNVDQNADDQVQSSTTQRSLALAAISQNKVFLCPGSQSFIVEGSKGDKYAVTLAPKEECQCPSIGTCYHIMAARMSVGLEVKSDKTIYNLTQLRKNSRKRPDKYAGKKKPRPIDKMDVNESVIVAAPDSILMKPEFDNNTECLVQFSSTPAAAKSPESRTPKSFLKRKSDSEFKSVSKRPRLTEKSKQMKLSLPKTRRRKSLINSFSEVSSDQRLGDSVDCRMTGLSPILENDPLLKESDVNEISNNLATSGRSATEDTRSETTIPYGSSSVADDIAFQKTTSESVSEDIPKKDIIVISDENVLAPTAVKDTDDAENKNINVKARRVWRVLPSKKFSLSFGDKNDLRCDKKLNSDIINFHKGY